MKRKSLGMITLVAMLFVMSFAADKVFATDATDVTTDTSQSQKEKPSKEENKEKMEEAVAKWNKLSDKDKSSVYTLLEAEKTASDKILDQLVTLGIMDQDEVTAMKENMSKRLATMKEEGSFPLGRPCPKEKNE